jgi:hypothetical protein
MFWLLDRATQLTNLRRETPCPEPLTCAAALKTTARRRRFCLLMTIRRSERFERYPLDKQRARAS